MNTGEQQSVLPGHSDNMVTMSRALVTLVTLVLTVLVSVKCQDIEVLSHICKYGVHADGVRYFYLLLITLG